MGCPAPLFFGRLEHQHSIAGKVACGSEKAGGANENGGVAVVAAAVHQTIF